MRFLFINGPNINITRFTEPGVEGEVDYNGLLISSPLPLPR